MLKTILILLKESGILLFEKNFSALDADSQLFSGLLTAVQNICIELNIGECNSFSSKQYKIITASKNYVLVTLIIDKKDPHIESFWDKLALEIGETFENQYNLDNFHGKISIFDDFNITLQEILHEKDIFI
ncbi:MAG: hypothetical protein ACTSO9_02845 [Candidatus Helarchaeota archaeon]